MSNLIIYDDKFNANEWFVILGLFTGLLLFFTLPRRFSRKLMTIFFLCGVMFATLFDLTLGAIPVSFYDVGDISYFETMDTFVALMYGPFSYLFFYLYDLLQIKFKFSPLYILSWALISVGIEWLGVRLGVYHYVHGYGLQVSFVIYLIVQSVWVLFFYFIKRSDLHM